MAAALDLGPAHSTVTGSLALTTPTIIRAAGTSAMTLAASGDARVVAAPTMSTDAPLGPAEIASVGATTVMFLLHGEPERAAEFLLLYTVVREGARQIPWRR